MTVFEIRFERLVDASPETAFDLWNDAEARVRWHKPHVRWIVEASTDLRVGGTWRVVFGPSPNELTIEEGRYEVVDRPNLVIYTCTHRLAGRPMFETRITMTFEARERRTLVTLVETGFPDHDLRQHFEDGWPAFLNTYVALNAER